MVTTLSLNPSIDRSISVQKFVYGGMNRVSKQHEDPAGKAINVAVAASRIGLQTNCIGFMRKDGVSRFEKLLIRNGVGSEFIVLEGRVRVNIKLFDESKSVVTEINEPGDEVSTVELDKMTQLVLEHAADADYLVLTGSLPPGCPSSFYATLIEAVRGLNCRCVLDAEGEALRLGMAARPFLVKPNRRELESAVGRNLNALSDILDAARRIQDGGVEYVAVSMGEHGAVLVGPDKAYTAPGMNVPVRSTVGAGDSMIAGLVAGFLGEHPMERAFRMGMASATASIMTEGTRLLHLSDYKRLYDEITIKEVVR